MLTILRNYSLMKILSITLMIAFIGGIYASCSHEDSGTIEPKNEESLSEFSHPIEVEPTPGASVGQMHNEAVLGYIKMIAKHGGEKVPYEEARAKAVWWMNKIAEIHGYEDRVTLQDFDERIELFIELREKKICDLFNPISVDLKETLKRMKSEGIISPEKAQEYLEVYIDFENRLRNNLNATRETPLGIVVEPISPEVDILYSSAEVWRNMEAYVKEHPELQGWWDKWKKTIWNIGLLTSDFIGFVICSPGTPIAAAFCALLASIAFTLAWPPY